MDWLLVLEEWVMHANNCIVLYGRWVSVISWGLHCDQLAPRQYNAPMDENPHNPAMSSHAVFQGPLTLS